MKPRIFISAVSEEFATLRDQHVDPLLRKLGYEPIAMKTFPTGGGDLRQFLREQIDSCEGLIQLVGAGYGREPPNIDPDYQRVSYTQFEFYYARLKSKKHWVFTAGDGEGVQRDKPVAELGMMKWVRVDTDELDAEAETGSSDPTPGVTANAAGSTCTIATLSHKPGKSKISRRSCNRRRLRTLIGNTSHHMPNSPSSTCFGLQHFG